MLQQSLRVDHAINFLGRFSSMHILSTLASIQQSPRPPDPLLSSWSKSSPILAILTPLCQTMPCYSPLRNSRAGVMREALATSQVHHTTHHQWCCRTSGPGIQAGTLHILASSSCSPPGIRDAVSPDTQDIGLLTNELLKGC